MDLGIPVARRYIFDGVNGTRKIGGSADQQGDLTKRKHGDLGTWDSMEWLKWHVQMWLEGSPSSKLAVCYGTSPFFIGKTSMKGSYFHQSESTNGSFSIAMLFDQKLTLISPSYGWFWLRKGGHVPAFYHRGGEGIPVPWFFSRSKPWDESHVTWIQCMFWQEYSPILHLGEGGGGVGRGGKNLRPPFLVPSKCLVFWKG